MDKKKYVRENLKLADYIQGNHIKRGNFIFINPCPICGHNDHFKINTEKNLFISHSGCCKGGSIIDWFVESEKISLSDSIKKCYILAGLEDKAPSLSDIKKYKEEKQKLNEIETKKKEILDLFKLKRLNLVDTIKLLMSYSEIKLNQKTIVIYRCYHKLTKMCIALNNLKNKSPFLHWLLNFLDAYTNRFVEATNEDEMYNLCLNFKEEFNVNYNEFVRFERELIDIVGKADELKLYSGGI